VPLVAPEVPVPLVAPEVPVLPVAPLGALALAGTISAAWPAAKLTPATLKGESELTMVKFPSFCTSATRMSVASEAAGRVASVAGPEVVCP
jgi:hypothetical protein